MYLILKSKTYLRSCEACGYYTHLLPKWTRCSALWKRTRSQWRFSASSLLIFFLEQLWIFPVLSIILWNYIWHSQILSFCFVLFCDSTQQHGISERTLEGECSLNSGAFAPFTLGMTHTYPGLCSNLDLLILEHNLNLSHVRTSQRDHATEWFQHKLRSQPNRVSISAPAAISCRILEKLHIISVLHFAHL